MLELDHVFCMVADPDQAARRLEDAGWALDAGQAHRGQGTRNRRLPWPGQFLELVWITHLAEARANPLRLDRRGAPDATASPFGVGLRGRLEPSDRDAYWLYDALGPRIWIHGDNETHPERPLVFVLELDAPRTTTLVHRQPGALREVRLRGPSAPTLPRFAGPPILCTGGEPRLELVVDAPGSPLHVEEHLILRRA